MLSIKLQSLDLLNFQGTKKAHYDFNETESWVCGDNGTGKTTIVDSFMWCLFGKNSKGKTDKDFDLKTLDANGEVIWQQPHEVTATLLVGNDIYTFRRCFCEKWVKQRGSVERNFEGHETQYYVNDVPKSMKDYKAKVAEIIDEETFRFVTDPAYFLSLKKDVQRNILLAMYGDVDDSEIAEYDSRFPELLAKLTGKTLDEYKEQLKAQYATIKKSCEIIPVQIEERQRSIAEIPEEDWAKVEEELAGYNKQQEEIKKEMTDIASRISFANEKQAHYAEELQRTQMLLAQKRAELNVKFLTDYYEGKNEKSRLEREIATKENVVTMNEKQLKLIKADKVKYNDNIFATNKEIAEQQALTYKSVRDDFTCPTCGRVFGADRQKEIYEEMLAKFNERKANTIKLLNERKQAALDALETLVEQEQSINADSIKKHTKIGMMRTQLKQYTELPDKEPDVTERINNSEEIKNLLENEETIKRSMKMFAAPTDNSKGEELSAQLDKVQGYINDLNAMLANKAMIERDQKRIVELTEELKSQSQEMATLEAELQTIYDFRKAKVEAIESKINAQFDIVKFRMFKQQINGGEQEDCEALVGGVPYSRSLNNSARINAGLDIVNAFSRHHNVSAPVFVDNAEASNHFVQMACQRIFLRVTTDKQIIIKSNEL